MAEVGSAYVTILPSTKGFGRKLSGELGGPSDRAGRDAGSRAGRGFSHGISPSLGRVGKTIIGAFAGISAVHVFQSFISEAEESRKIGRLTEQVIKSTGAAAGITAKQVGDLATAISNKTGIDDEAIQSGENLLLTFTNVRNEVGKGNDIFNRATGLVADMSVALGQDMKSGSIQLGKALNDPVKGVTALSRVGVSFTKQQKDQIKTLVASGKTLDAQKIILNELGKEFGGAAAAAATPSQKLAVVFGNLKEQIGTALLPTVDRLASFLGGTLVPGISRLGSSLSRTLGPAFAKIGQGVQVFFDALTGKSELNEFDGALKTANNAGIAIADSFRNTIIPSLKNLWKTVQPLLTDALGVLVDAFRTVTDGSSGFGSVIKSVTGFMKEHKTIVQAIVVGVLAAVVAFKVWMAVTKAFTAIQLALNTALMANPIGLIILGVIALAAGLIYAYKHSEKFRNIVQGAMHAVAKAVDFVKDHWRTFATAFAFLLGGPVIGGLVLLVTHFGTVKRIAEDVFGAVGRAASGMWNNVLRPTLKFLMDAWLAVVGALVHGAAKAFGWVPGIGPKLKAAARAFDRFRDEANAALSGIHDRTVKVTIIAGHKVDVNSQAGLQRFAAGGFPRPGLALVGEEGPELVRFRGDEHVSTASQTRRMLSSLTSAQKPTTVNYWTINEAGHSSAESLYRAQAYNEFLMGD